MDGMAAPHGRWADDPQPDVVYTPTTYSHTAAGPVRRASFRSAGGQLLGTVWTDDQDAAGFTPDDSAGPPAVQAAAYVWTLLAECRAREVPAAELLDAAMYEPYQLDV